MELKHLLMLALLVSVFCMVFGFGLRATWDDLLYLIRRPGLLLRSLLAVFVIMPVVAFALTRLFHFRHTVEVVLIALAISPVPPLLPKRELIAGGHDSYGLGLMAILALLSIAIIPLAVEILERISDWPFEVSSGVVAALALKTVLLPLATGMVVRATLPQIAERIAKPVTVFANVLLPLAAIVPLIGAMPAIWALIGEGTLIAMAAFAAVGLAVGHFMGGPDPGDSIVLALSSACRHPAIALAIATAAFPHEHFGATIVLYLLVGVIVSVPYIAYVRKSTGRQRATVGNHANA